MTRRWCVLPFFAAVLLALSSTSCGNSETPYFSGYDSGPAGCALCQVGAKQCSGDGFQECIKLSTGCTAWGEIKPCKVGTPCKDGSCVGACTNQCSEDAKQCSGDGFVACVRKDTGCTDWADEVACKDSTICSGGTCVKSCVNQCTAGAKQCSGSGGIQSCEMQKSGCTDWNPAEDCPTGNVCSGGRCVKNCVNQCTQGAKQCSGTGYQSCDLLPAGCTDWGDVKPCGTGLICSGGQCVKNCVNQCLKGQKQCSGTGTQECVDAPSGCTDWGNVTPCSDGTVCDGGECKKSCVNRCTQGDKQCSASSNGWQGCELLPSGCTGWGSITPCNLGETCSGGKCQTSCSNLCTKGQTRCYKDQVQTCETQTNGCTDWSQPKACSSGVCVNGKCDTGVCAKGDRRCNGNNVEECNSNGFWFTVQNCPHACTGGQCTVTVTCKQNERRCNGSNVEICNTTGSAWLFLKACSYSCQTGLCAGGCTPGKTRCNGSLVEQCDSTGSKWVKLSDCSTTFCTTVDDGKTDDLAICAESELRKSGNGETVLDGEHAYAGDVQIMIGHKIKVGPKGWLRIRAKNIAIDQTSTIEAPPVGDDPTGRGADYNPLSCYDSSYGYSCSYPLSATGGGYGISPSGSSSSCKACSYTYCKVCSQSQAGGTANGDSVADIHMGSRGGSCSKPNGGGLIDLIATDTIKCSGNLLAAGGGNSEGGGGNCAGGSGGGIRLASEDIDLSGTISVAGGSNGGVGRIKILHGANIKNTASTSGALEVSYMPPLTLSSSTHPNPALYYNDSFESYSLSWSRPFSNTSGYHYVLNQTLPTVPSPTASHQTGETISFLATDPALKVNSRNYFHVVSVASGGTLGKVEKHHSVYINGQPEIIASSSHAAGTWTNNSHVYFTWSDPSGVPAGSFAAYYYVLDPYPTTLPTRTDSKVSATDKRQLEFDLPTSTMRFLHVIAEDTAANLTKAAAHYKVNIGPEPKVSQYYGFIKDKVTNKGIGSVELSLNRGLITVKSLDPDGQFTFPTSGSTPIYEGEYELRATKAGYKDYLTKVTVPPPANPVTLLLEPAP